ncbi:MAG: hypothetical protein NW206_20940 [Hyphomonadaceae bacterium]|nr:hypothetical protein [Hyphomonadaceae bacterium]
MNGKRPDGSRSSRASAAGPADDFQTPNFLFQQRGVSTLKFDPLIVIPNYSLGLPGHKLIQRGTQSAEHFARIVDRRDDARRGASVSHVV